MLSHIDDAIAAGDFGVPVLKYLTARNVNIWISQLDERYPGANILHGAVMLSALHVATK